METVSKLHQEIRKLTQEWYSLISSDHHKDRDCHFYIETIWSYGDGPRFVPRHYGYVISEDEFEKDIPKEAEYGGAYKEGFTSYEDALTWLRDRVQKMVLEERSFQENHNQDGECKQNPCPQHREDVEA